MDHLAVLKTKKKKKKATILSVIRVLLLNLLGMQGEDATYTQRMMAYTQLAKERFRPEENQVQQVL